jgi:serine/threonine protein kinase
MERPQEPSQRKVKPPPSLKENVAAARESVGGVIRAQIITEEARLNQAKDQNDFQRCMELQQSVQQLKQQLELVTKEAEEKVRKQDAERIRNEAERKKREEAERMAREEQKRRAAEERKEAAARAKQAVERKAREEAEQQWSSFESVLQGENSKAEALLEKALAAKQYVGPESTAEIQPRIDQLAQLRQQGEQLKQRAGPGQAEQQELKRQLEELSASIAHRPQQPQDLRPHIYHGANLDHYTLGQFLRGSSGECQLQHAVYNPTNTPVVLKLFDPQAVDAARREMAVYQHLFRTGGKNAALFVTELAGASLLIENANLMGQHCLPIAKGEVDFGEMLVRADSWSVPTKTQFCYQMAEVVRLLHACGVIWGDLKPSNFINFIQDYQPKLKGIDFGEACVVYDVGIQVDRSVPHDFKPSDKITPEYCSPERMMAVKQGKSIRATPQHDIWSLGMAIYQVLVGRHYFHGKSDGQIIEELTKPDFRVDLTAITNREATSVLTQMLQLGPYARGTIDRLIGSKHFFIGGASVSGTRLVRIENALQDVEQRLVHLEDQLSDGWQQIVRSSPEGEGTDRLLVLLKQYIDSRDQQMRDFIGAQ